MEPNKKHKEKPEEMSPERRDKLLITQVLEALARSIDAKDKYTNGRSRKTYIIWDCCTTSEK